MEDDSIVLSGHTATVRCRLGRIHPPGGLNAERPKYFEPDSAWWWRKGIPPKRDSFRERAYTAENRFVVNLVESGAVEPEPFEDLTDIAKFARSMIESVWFRRRFPMFTELRIVTSARMRGAYAGPDRYVRSRDLNSAEVSKGYMVLTEKVFSERAGTCVAAMPRVLFVHELAHAVLPGNHQHDRRWCRTYAEFVGWLLGQEHKKALLAEFKRERVPYSPFKRMNNNAEQAERLAVARAMRRNA